MTTAFDKYRSIAAITNSDLQQAVFIFDEITKLLYAAKKSVEERNYELKFKYISRIINAFLLLRSEIDVNNLNQSTEILDMFYVTTIKQLEKVNRHDVDAYEIHDIIDAITKVRSAISDSIKVMDKHTPTVVIKPTKV